MTLGEKTNCPDCGVEPGSRHVDGCDVARCVICGGQAFCHGDEIEEKDGSFILMCENVFEPIPEENQIWTGWWPGIEECEEFGWFSRWTLYVHFDGTDFHSSPSPIGDETKPTSGPSVACSPDHPFAHHDLNRLIMEGMRGRLTWDRERTRWVPNP
ncbi:MAG: hypothetical protein WC054_00540 [Candidatus Nanopelagicales bacterium]